MDLLLQVFGSSMAFLGLSFLIFAPLELLVPARDRRQRPPLADWIHFLANPAFGVWFALTVLAFTGGLIRALLPAAVLHWTAEQSMGIQMVTAVALAQLWGYWTHRLSHSVPWLWRFHRIHHSIEEMTWVSALRQHPFDVALTVAGANLPAFALGIDLTPLAAIILLERCYTIFLHANLDCHYGWFGRILASPRFHHWHHDRGPVGNQHNFAGTFSLLDWIFGTYHEPVQPPGQFGCSEPTPVGYVNQILVRQPDGAKHPPDG